MMGKQKLLERMWDVLQIELAYPWRFLFVLYTIDRMYTTISLSICLIINEIEPIHFRFYFCLKSVKASYLFENQ